jgi:hypothetical protein
MEKQEQLPTEQENTSSELNVPAVEPDGATPERLTAENTELRTALRAAEARGSLTTALITAGARTPNLLLNAAADAMQFTDDGSLANTEALVASLRTRFPEQFRVARAGSIDAERAEAHRRRSRAKRSQK